MPDIAINGPEGRIEARYHISKNPRAPIALVLHPHPEHGGTMNNKIVYNLYRAFVDHGFNTLRFNFRGVGRSEGKFDHGEGELSDAASVLDWLQTQNPNASGCWIGGFSFGSWIGMQLLMRRPEIENFIMVSPPANLYDFSFLAPCPVSGMIIQGSADPVVPFESVDRLVNKLNSQRGISIDYRLVPQADHFFTQDMDTLNEYSREHLANCIGPATAVA